LRDLIAATEGRSRTRHTAGRVDVAVLKPGDMVEVEWLDSQVKSGWGSPKEHTEDAVGAEAIPMHSVGYLLYALPKSIAIYQTAVDWGAERGVSLAESLSIPRAVVVKVRKVR
jgi:hypothetical protein